MKCKSLRRKCFKDDDYNIAQTQPKIILQVKSRNSFETKITKEKLGVSGDMFVYTAMDEHIK